MLRIWATLQRQFATDMGRGLSYCVFGTRISAKQSCLTDKHSLRQMQAWTIPRVLVACSLVSSGLHMQSTFRYVFRSLLPKKKEDAHVIWQLASRDPRQTVSSTSFEKPSGDLHSFISSCWHATEWNHRFCREALPWQRPAPGHRTTQWIRRRFNQNAATPTAPCESDRS